MTNPLALKLEQFTSFSDAERARLDFLAARPRKTYARGATIIAEGEKVASIHLVLEGLAVRAKTLRDGDRQIMAFLVPRTCAMSKCSCWRRWTMISSQLPTTPAPLFPPR